jgi:hypothetical protein
MFVYIFFRVHDTDYLQFTLDQIKCLILKTFLTIIAKMMFFNLSNFCCRSRTLHNNNGTSGQFHQHSTSSFCASRSQKRKKILTT